MVEILSTEPKVVLVTEMRDGDIAIIREHPISSNIGLIVQRYKDILVTIGLPSSQSFPTPFQIRDPVNFKLEILGPGTTLIIK